MQHQDEMIVWLFKGQEVGRAILPERTMGYQRLEIAKQNGIKEFDNFLFLDKYGKVRMEGNSVTFEEQPYGKKHGADYQEYLKTNTNP